MIASLYVSLCALAAAANLAAAVRCGFHPERLDGEFLAAIMIVMVAADIALLMVGSVIISLI